VHHGVSDRCPYPDRWTPTPNPFVKSERPEHPARIPADKQDTVRKLLERSRDAYCSSGIDEYEFVAMDVEHGILELKLTQIIEDIGDYRRQVTGNMPMVVTTDDLQAPRPGPMLVLDEHHHITVAKCCGTEPHEIEGVYYYQLECPRCLRRWKKNNMRACKEGWNNAVRRAV